MGWAVEKDGDDYVIWSNADADGEAPIHDGVLTRKEAARIYAMRGVMAAKVEAIKTMMSFPELKQRRDLSMHAPGPGIDAFMRWYDTALKADDYYKAIETKFNEIVMEMPG